MRVESAKPTSNGGWLHRLKDSADTQRPRVRRATVALKTAPDLGELARRFQQAARASDVERLADSLGVSVESLQRLHVGFDGSAWCFPMRDATGRVIGIRRRFADGRKLSVRGGREGLFIPEGIADGAPVVVTEGPTDCAAILTLGLDAIGRPSCRGGCDALAEYCRGRRVAILADADEPGRIGAWLLAELLKLVCPSVRVVRPPERVKDARQWVNSGATRAEVLRAIQQVEPVRPKVGAENE